MDPDELYKGRGAAFTLARTHFRRETTGCPLLWQYDTAAARINSPGNICIFAGIAVRHRIVRGSCFAYSNCPSAF